MYKKKWQYLIAALIFLALNLWVIVPYYWTSGGECFKIYKEFRILLANVHTANRQHEKVIKLIEKEKPDLLILQEVDRVWIEKLQYVCIEYEKRLIIPRSDNFGIAVFSKDKKCKLASYQFIHQGVPSIILKSEDYNKKYTIISTHLLPPVSRNCARIRNKQLEEIAKYINHCKNPVILAGDLNITMWSHYYCKFIQRTGLINARKGFGIKPTWPCYIPFMFIPIDHCLHTKDFQVVNFRTGPQIGSDHLPVIVDIRMKK